METYLTAAAVRTSFWILRPRRRAEWSLKARKRAEIGTDHLAGFGRIYRRHYRRNVVLDDVPAIRREGDDGQFLARQVLFVFERSVAGYQHFESGILRSLKQRAVLEARKSGVDGGDRFVLREMLPQSMR